MSKMRLNESYNSSSLLGAVDAGQVRLYACCGGQGPSNLTGLDDLVHLFINYSDCSPIQLLFASAARRLESLAKIPHRSAFFTGRGFYLQAWLDDHAASAPSADELALSPFSFPINTLVSLVHYALAAHSLHLDPTQVRDRLYGVAGHSQGLFAAAAIAHAGTGWSAFYQAADLALQLSFWVGLEAHAVAPGSILSAEEVQNCLDHDEGTPSYLLSVVGIRPKDLASILRQLNHNHVDDEGLIAHIALVNGHNKSVLAGTPQALQRVCMALRTRKASVVLDQSRVPFSKRLPVVDVQFLPISAPYHSPLLESVEPYVANALTKLRLTGNDLAVPVYHSLDGHNLQNHESEDLLRILVRAVTTERVDWPTTCRQMEGATHILALGPGPVGSLVQDVMEGTGLRIIPLSGRALPSGLSSLAVPEISPSYALPWGQKYHPRLRKDPHQGISYIETKMTRLLGTPPVMVAGMTPTTNSPDFVAAIMQAGYHVEFACGGYHEQCSMEAALRHLAATIPLHRAITCNVIYSSPKSLSWQIELLRNLIHEGLPIEGLTVGAGIPSPEVIREWIDSLGLRHIWFKPGSVSAIDQVLAIAHQHPAFPIGLQWTGGRAGGHHSNEDFHQPVLERYGRIRGCENIVLVAGSGFGDGNDTWPYLTGSWSQPLGYAAMPFDGVLLGSRMMVAREAKTSPTVKQLIIDTRGVEDDNNGAWTRSEQEPVGGVISVTSEMGQPIHVLANRGMRLWHEFDQRFFSIRDTEKFVKTLRQHRCEIITRLNKDYARPWFSMIETGQAVEMEDLTYRQVLHRLCELLYVTHQARWIHSSYLTLVHDFLRLAHARFGHGVKVSDDPSEVLETFAKTYKELVDESLYPEDVGLLLALFRRRGQKPVPFIPRLDADFETWFKKDSLWQSEDIEAVPDQDAQRVCIIHGPVAARHSTSCNEPAGLILDRINDAHIKMLHQQSHNEEEDEETRSPEMALNKSLKLSGVRVSQDGPICRYHLIGPAVPSTEVFIEHIVGDCIWARAALIRQYMANGHIRVKNPIRNAFKPEIGDVVDVCYKADRLCEITLYTASLKGDSKQPEAVLELSCNDRGRVTMVLLMSPFMVNTNGRPALELTMDMIGRNMEHRVLQISREDYLNRVRRLYTQLWIAGPSQGPSSVGLNSEFAGDRVVITANAVKAFLGVIQRTGPTQCHAWDARGSIVPLDYAVVVAWTVLTKPVLLPALDGDPVHLLHQSISMRLSPGVRPLHVGDAVTTSSRITERTITATGQVIEVSAEIHRAAELVVHIRSVFVLQRCPQSASQQQFRSNDEPDMIMHLSSPVQVQLLLSRKWLLLDDTTPDLLGKTLVFRLNTQTVYDATGTPTSLQVAGMVSLLPDRAASSASMGAQLGRVYLEEEGCRVNPVLGFLNRHATPRIRRQTLKNPGWAGDQTIFFTAPVQSSSYACVSQDANPIHICPLFARFAGHGQPVVHGMHLSATVRRILEWTVGDTYRSRFRSWKASFDGIVRAGDRLQMVVQHCAMEEGLLVVQVNVFNKISGYQVMRAEATIKQASTAYVFCGQGSQEKGMGMELYRTHTTAQAVWDKAESHFESQYGVSLLKIVRENPTSLTVHFGGRRGRHVRANYLAMTSGPDSNASILPDLTAASRSYTFSHPAGLLMSTQFAQPALAVMEMAEYAHLQAQGVVQKPSLFAGHSLGEYSALGACTSFMPFEALLSLIFYRGLKMQNALPRDANGRTDYGMMATDPSRIGPEFTERDFMDLVQLISQEMGLLLEVVNHNVKSRQYVCAGHVQSLWVMGHVCDELATSSISNKLGSLRECIRRYMNKAQSVSNQTNLTRGRATIPLGGVDIPFHSKMLRGHIDNYRQYLRHHLRISDLKPDEFIGRWIPNVVGKPFALDGSYIRLVQQVTGSQPLQELLERLGEHLQEQ